MKDKRNSFKGQNTTICYSEKVDAETYYGLVQLGLAEQISEDQFCVEIHTANVLVYLIATEIGSKGEYTPSTDEIHYIEPSFFQSVDNHNKTSLRSEILDQILPSPLEFEIKNLLNFKEKHRSDLADFRDEIELCVDTLAVIQNEQDRATIKLRHITQLQKRVRYLSEKMKESKLKKVVNSTWFGVVLSGATAYFTGGTTPLITGAMSTTYGGGKSLLKGDEIDQSLRYVGLLTRNFSKD